MGKLNRHGEESLATIEKLFLLHGKRLKRYEYCINVA